MQVRSSTSKHKHKNHHKTVDTHVYGSHVFGRNAATFEARIKINMFIMGLHGHNTHTRTRLVAGAPMTR